MQRAFYENTMASPPRPWLKKAISVARKKWGGKKFLTGRTALDIGSGSGSDTVALIRAGFKVTALDPSKLSSKFLRKKIKILALPTPKIINSKIQSLTRKRKVKFDLVNASYTLPFIPPKEFPSELKRISNLVNPGGIISFNVFGNRDTWRKESPHMTFITKSQAKKLLPGFLIISFKEWEHDAFPAVGPKKHWHMFSIVAKKKLRS